MIAGVQVRDNECLDSSTAQEGWKEGLKLEILMRQNQPGGEKEPLREKSQFSCLDVSGQDGDREGITRIES